MTNVNLPSPNLPKPPHSASPAPRPQPEKPASAAPSLRETAGAKAPASLGSPAIGYHFEKRSVPAPELVGARKLIDEANPDLRTPREVLKDLEKGRDHFAGYLARGEQTRNFIFNRDGARTQTLINPILKAENARTPGLNAVGFSSGEQMVDFLRDFSTPAHDGQEGHIRCHVGVKGDSHRIAVDAFKHREGGFTLVAVDSGERSFVPNNLPALEKNNPDVIKGIFLIHTFNQVHNEGCRIFAVHTLNAMHDYQPHIHKLHRMVYDHGVKKSAAQSSASNGKPEGGNTLILGSEVEAFRMLPGKFFKHMQVLKPKGGKTGSVIDDAENFNPALKHEVLNKKGQTLRKRFESLNPNIEPEKAALQFSRADRTSSVDRKRLVLIDRAIAHYKQLDSAKGNALPDPRIFWLENSWI